jgi:hypothetical protein
MEEKHILEQHVGRKVLSVSKHGSGGAKYGFHHYAPYEPVKYVAWALKASMRMCFGNLEDPSLDLRKVNDNFLFSPGAFWLEPAWRDIEKYSVQWLLDNAQRRDIVMLVHPENTLAEPDLVADFKAVIHSISSRVF